jgi:DNA-binding protein H-NS
LREQLFAAHANFAYKTIRDLSPQSSTDQFRYFFLKTNMPSYKELLAQKQNLEAQIEAARKSEISEALSTIQGLVKEFGLSASDVFPAGRAKSAAKGSTVAPKYRDPGTGATWTGRGKAPLWIANKDRAQFEIK